MNLKITFEATDDIWSDCYSWGQLAFSKVALISAIDFEIYNVTPIQVIEDVTLVEDKDMMVRVYINLTGGKWPKADLNKGGKDMPYIGPVKVRLRYGPSDDPKKYSKTETAYLYKDHITKEERGKREKDNVQAVKIWNWQDNKGE